ncbi:MAG: type II toxin-antitoxin system ParD family antitoxin [Alphaproteobacteria bacterium]|nr:type II toxin-antitoxin system ParD family antitoxin [Alphaproteobacteria bacterium]
MAEIERMTIALTAEMAKTVRAAVEAGEYASSSEIIREALRDWTDKRFLRQRDLEELRASIQEGLDDIKAGRVYTVDEVRKQLRAHFRTKGRRRRAS